MRIDCAKESCNRNNTISPIARLSIGTIITKNREVKRSVPKVKRIWFDRQAQEAEDDRQAQEAEDDRRAQEAEDDRRAQEAED
ncbi:hypothetical protein LSAT2_027385, partial [Lamellibrachia satsuma]